MSRPLSDSQEPHMASVHPISFWKQAADGGGCSGTAAHASPLPGQRAHTSPTAITPVGAEGPDPAPHLRGAPCPSEDVAMASVPLAAGFVTWAGECVAAHGPRWSCRGPRAIAVMAPVQQGGAAGPVCVMPCGTHSSPSCRGGFVAKPSQARPHNPGPREGREEQTRLPAMRLTQLHPYSAHQQDLLSSSLPHVGTITVPLLPQRGGQLGCWESSCLHSLAQGAGVARAGGLLGRKLS